MSFRLVPKSVTLSDLERRNDRYSALFHQIRVPLPYRREKSSRSLSHLLTSFLSTTAVVLLIEINVAFYLSSNRRRRNLVLDVSVWLFWLCLK